MGYATSSSSWVVRESPEEPYGMPRDDSDDHLHLARIDELGHEIALLAAHLNAAEHRFLSMIAEFDRLRGWHMAGYADCARWLHARTGMRLGSARERVRAARALESLPLTSAAMARGELSFSKVRALSRAATAENEAALLELAVGATTDQLERMIRSLRFGSRDDETAFENARHALRSFSIFVKDNGMYGVRGELEPEVGSLLMRAIEAASDVLFRERRVLELMTDQEKLERAAQLRADAIGLLAERALAAGFGGRDDRGQLRAGNASAETSDAIDTRAGGALTGHTGTVAADAANPIPLSGSRAERYQVMLHVDDSTLTAGGDPGRSELEEGTRVSAETARRIACDASVVMVVEQSTREGPDLDTVETASPESCDSRLPRVSAASRPTRVSAETRRPEILSVGRRTRTISPALRRALEVRDRGCRFPRCGLRFTDAHHVKHWADGGETSLGNTLLLCRHHHRLVHEGGWRIVWWGVGKPAFYDPHGHVHFDGGWESPVLPEGPVPELLRQNLVGGANPDEWTAASRWERECDIPLHVRLKVSEVT